MSEERIVYITGEIVSTKGRAALEKAIAYYEGQGYIVDHMAEELMSNIPKEVYTLKVARRIGCADEVCFIDGWRDSDTAQLDRSICTFLDKPVRQFWV